MKMLEQDLLEEAMLRALTLARRGPTADENPQVGCVILDGEGRIVAEGWHMGAGSRHAEVDALAHLPAEWRARAAELTAVVTLEPCNHTGHTGPCSQMLIRAGIGAVAYALPDRGAQSGGGATVLETAGMSVRGGVRATEAERLIAPWLQTQTAHGAPATSPVTSPAMPPVSTLTTPTADSSKPRPRRPRIIVKWAQTLDGRAAAQNGTSQWITGPEAREDVHRRRAEADAILTGTGTLYADDPSLTARSPQGGLLVPANEQPIPVVLGQRPIPESARIRQHPALEVHGLDAPIHLAGNDLEAELSTLARYRIYSVFVEAGPRLINTLLAKNLVDEMLIYVAPAILGGSKVAIGHLGISDISEIRRLDVSETIALGPDLLFRAEWHHGSTMPGPIADSFSRASEASQAHAQQHSTTPSHDRIQEAR